MEIEPQAWVRSKTGIPLKRAAAISALSSCTAAVRTTNSTSSVIFSALCPMSTGMPLSLSAWMLGPSFMSEPVMTSPMPCSTSASDDMDTPPMPIRCPLRPGERKLSNSSISHLLMIPQEKQLR